MPIGFQRYRRRAFVTIETPEDDTEYREAFQRLLDTLYLLDSNGIQLLPGTDNSNAFPVHRELELYVEAGLTPARALALGTLEAERFLGRDAWLGSIEVGKRADFTIFSADIMTIDAPEILTVDPWMTIVEGEAVWESPYSFHHGEGE